MTPYEMLTKDECWDMYLDMLRIHHLVGGAIISEGDESKVLDILIQITDRWNEHSNGSVVIKP